MGEDLIYRLRKRAEIRRNIPSRKSVLLGESDRIADLLEEAAIEIEKSNEVIDTYKRALTTVAEPYWELSHDKIRFQRDDYKRIAMRALEQHWVAPKEELKSTEMDDNF